jgi:hypothetical protein
MNRAMLFAGDAADLMQRFSRLPTEPYLGLLPCRKTILSSWSHGTPPLKKDLYLRRYQELGSHQQLFPDSLGAIHSAVSVDCAGEQKMEILVKVIDEHDVAVYVGNL